MRKNLIKRFLYTSLKDVFVPVLCGKLKGKLWSLGCGKILKFLTTTYEKQLINLFLQYVYSDNIVYDIGAHIGYFSLLSSMLVGNNGKVYAFEPNKDNLVVLSKHIEKNNCKNIIVVKKAVSDKKGFAFFSLGSGSGTGKISDKGEYQVETISLDEFVFEERNPVPNIIKIDVEGEEFNVLKGAQKLLSKYHPTIFLSTHSEQLYKDCVEYLSNMGYKIKSVAEMSDLIVAERQTNK